MSEKETGKMSKCTHISPRHTKRAFVNTHGVMVADSTTNLDNSFLNLQERQRNWIPISQISKKESDQNPLMCHLDSIIHSRMDFAQIDSLIAVEERTAPEHNGDQCSMRNIYLNETDLSQ